MKIDSTTIRKAIGAASLALMIAGGATATFAANVDVTDSNGTTGQSSINTNTHNIHDHSSVHVNQSGLANNDVTVGVSNGGNHVTGNTTVAGFSTGDVMVSGSLNSDVNTTPVVAMDSSSDGTTVTGTFSNDNTGPNSSNTNTLNVTNDNHFTVTRTATINNNVEANLSSGGNTVTHNTTVGNVSTGDVAFSMTSTKNA